MKVNKLDMMNIPWTKYCLDWLELSVPKLEMRRKKQ